MVAAALLVTVLELYFPFFEVETVAVPFIIIMATAALFSDYIAGVLAIVVGSLCLDYLIVPHGFKLDLVTARKIGQFAFIGLAFCVMAWRSRRLQQNNESLVDKARRLESAIHELQGQGRRSTKQLAKLDAMNRQLEELVAQFMEDTSYWEARLASDIKDTKVLQRGLPSKAAAEPGGLLQRPEAGQ